MRLSRIALSDTSVDPFTRTGRGGRHEMNSTIEVISTSARSSDAFQARPMATRPTVERDVRQVIRSTPVDHRPAYLVTKRVFDILLAVIMLILLSPVLLVTAILVRASSPGPILYRQVRVGQDGHAFWCLKFRTMIPNAHQIKLHLISFNEASGPVFKLKRDPRITPVGRWLRKLSIDELPQLFNVIRGDMSIVGPRPPLPDEVEQYTDHQLGRLAVRPGLTCLWQVSGRSHIGFDEWVELDLHYIRRRSFWYDLWLIVLTIPAVITGRGAF